MSSDLAIQLKSVSKCYAIYARPEDRLKQLLVPRLQKFFGKTAGSFYREFWAVKDVSFDVRKGETIGIIGRNGSGKSTLLQMICGTLNLTNGQLRTNGRIAALLELGSGFNPEFTGRENVYINGAVLGLTKDLLDERFQAIASFADIGDFIDRPVKTYSSGMYVRLAFAVIAYVDADILIIDEALAVGDAIFNQKCMRFLRNFKERGTLIFVSHDMGSVLNLCDRVVWLHDGKLRRIGPSGEIAEAYLQFSLQELYGQGAKLDTVGAVQEMREDIRSVSTSEFGSGNFLDYESQVSVAINLDNASGWKTGVGEIVSVSLQKLNVDQNDVLQGGEMVCLVIRAIAHKRIESPILGFLVRDRLGQDLFGENTLQFTNTKPHRVEEGLTFEAEFSFRMPMLPNGAYVVMASLADGDLYNNVQHHWLHDALVFNVSSSKVRWGLVGVQFEKIHMSSIG